MIQGDAYYQSYICRIPRSTIEAGADRAARLRRRHAVPLICDVIRNLSGMWQMLFPGKYVRYVDVPQNYGRRRRRVLPGGDERSATASARCGRKITDDALNAPRSRSTTRTAGHPRPLRLPRRKPWQAPSSEVYLLMRAAWCCRWKSTTQLVRDYLVAAEHS